MAGTNMFDYLRNANAFGNPNAFGSSTPALSETTFNPSMVNVNGIRSNQIFAPQPVVPQDYQAPQDYAVTPDELDSLVNFQPSLDAENRYNELVNAMPQRPNPGILRRIGAALSSFSNRPDMPANVDRWKYGDYGQRMEDWKSKIGIAQNAANLERYGNINERMLATDIAKTRMGMRKAEETERHNRENEEANKLRNQAYEFKIKHPNHKFEVDPLTGHLHALNPLTNENVDLGKWDMTAADRYNFLLGNDLTRDAARNAAAIRLKASPSSGSDKPLPPSQEKILENMAYNSYIQHHYPGWDKITYNVDNGRYDVSIPPEDTDTLQKLMDYLGEYRSQFKSQYEGGNYPTRRSQESSSGNGGGGQSNGNKNQPKVMTKTQTNTVTKQKRTLYSTDGGATWSLNPPKGYK